MNQIPEHWSGEMPPSTNVLHEIFAKRLDGPPQRLHSTFDVDGAGEFMALLKRQSEHELAAHNTKASVIMPTYNRAHCLDLAITSVLGQSHGDLELLIIDDGSTDTTEDVVRAYRHDHRIQYQKVPHGGVCAARNLGLKQAKGEFIFYLDSDNRWSDDFIKLMLMAVSFAGSACAYSATRLHAEDGSVSGYFGEPFDREHCLNSNYVDLNVFCHSRKLYDTLGGFDPILRRMVDWDLILRYSKEHHPLYAPFLGCYYSQNANDSSRISKSQPFLFKKLVEEKNRKGHQTAMITAQDLCFACVLKVPEPAPPAIAELAETVSKALKGLGHRVRIDLQSDWYALHAHQNEVVIAFDNGAVYQPHPEQINILHRGEPSSGETGETATRYHACYPLQEGAVAGFAQMITNDIRRFLVTGTFPKQSGARET